MTTSILHPKTQADIEAFVAQPPHAALIIGPKGIGKGTILQLLAARLLQSEPDRLADDARYLRLDNEKTIGIDSIRELQHFLLLKPADRSDNRRVITIERADLLTLEAQNALLKSLEEPALGTTILLGMTHPQQVLPTIRSRSQPLQLQAPDKTALRDYLKAQGHADEAVDKAIAMSGGMPGLATSLLRDEDHPLGIAVDWCRKLLGASKFERMGFVDELSKQRELCLDICEVLVRMAQVALDRPGIARTQMQTWRGIMEQALYAAESLRRNAQTKLVLDSLLLHL